MPDVQEMTERHSAALKRVAEVAERLAMKHAALAADDPKEEAQATTAFQKATRVLRQSMALEAKLLRDVEQGVRAERQRADWALFAQTQTRKLQLKTTVERLIESESEDQERLCDELDDLLEIEVLAETFPTEDLTAQVTRLCKALGLTGFEVLAVLPPLSSRNGRSPCPGPIDPGPS